MAKLLTVKDIVSQASMELGIAQRPVSSVTNSRDQDIVQLTSLLSAVADEVLLNEPYSVTLGDGVWCVDAALKAKDLPSTDTDLILFDGRLCIDGLKFRFLQAKGLEFAEQMRDFTARLNKLAVKINARVLDLDVEPERAQ